LGDGSVPASGDLIWGALAGLAGALGLAALYQGIASATVAVVSPVAAATGAAVPVVFGFLLGERPAPLAWVGVLLALVAITFLTYQRHEEEPHRGRSLLLGLAAGAGFGLFFILISRTASDSGLWPLVSGRVVSVTGVGLFSLLTHRSVRVSSKARPMAGLAGLLDMGANVFFLLAARSGLLVISTVITSLYPAPTVILSAIVLHERVTPLRIAGLLLAVAGVTLMTL
jgi:drug/metabolite transporter (DMT)-like permease